MKLFAVPYLPERQRLDAYIDRIYASKWLTNNGQLLQEFEKRLKNYLGVDHLLLVANGTLALQIAYRAVGITCSRFSEQREVITTPFSFVATASSIVWDGALPVFSDIDADTFCMDPDLIESRITSNTSGIVPVHVFGRCCDVEAIDAIANKHKLPVVYDAAHAFAVEYKGQSLLNYGDASVLSFHATKLFHSIEGGAIVFKSAEARDKAAHMINFGIDGPEQVVSVGINAKMNEFQAAMGLAMLDEIEVNLNFRREKVKSYNSFLGNESSKISNDFSEGCSYYPIVLKSKSDRDSLCEKLLEEGIVVRKYFSPSLDELAFLNPKNINCGISRDISQRVVCLPIHTDLTSRDIELISNMVTRYDT